MPQFHIPLNTEIIPYSTKTGQSGVARLTTVEVDFNEEEILEKVSLKVTQNEIKEELYCLSLGENPTKYDSYLVRVKDLV
ncbi:MAG: hypothetical protein AAFX87_10685 [Bacteroidota bacterium]